MDKKAMLKEAAQILRSQQAEIHELQLKLATVEKAEQIVRSMIDNDALQAEDVFTKISDLRTKTIADLEIMEKAAEMYGPRITVGLGTLSNQAEYSSNPLLDYLFSEN